MADEPERIKCFPLYTILLALNRTQIDLLSLGCQGQELEILQTSKWWQNQSFNCAVQMINVLTFSCSSMGSRDCWRHQYSPDTLLAQDRLSALHKRADEVFRGHVLSIGVEAREEFRVSKDNNAVSWPELNERSYHHSKWIVSSNLYQIFNL